MEKSKTKMKKIYTTSISIEVEADNEEEAIEKMYEKLQETSINNISVYELDLALMKGGIQ